MVAAGRPHAPGSPLNQPLVPASNFVLNAERAYARDDGTPTWEALEDVIAELEGGDSVAFASGMAGASAIFDQVPAGAHIVLPDDCYQGVFGLADNGVRKGMWTVERLAVEDTAAWTKACQTADLLWLESPSNPLLKVADLRTICSAPKKPGALLAVDNTFATPLNQQPLDLGADFSFQSATKFIGGHSDLLAGIVTVRRPELLKALRHAREIHGATPGTLEAYLATRGARTMSIRLDRAQASAMTLARRLEAHQSVGSCDKSRRCGVNH